MVYSYEDLVSIIKAPVDANRWGKDTKKIIGMIRSIASANCSTCMLRRRIYEINTLMAPFGDSVSPITSGITTVAINGSRLACPDCVMKHLSQAYVLQGEFYQGYTEYIPLIESHLSEALEECPKSNTQLVSVIDSAIKSVVIDNSPKIPIILCAELIPAGFGDKNIAKKPENTSIHEICMLTSGIPIDILERCIRLLKNMPKLSTDASILEKSEICGRLACLSEILSPYSRKLAEILRDIRLWTNQPGISEDDLKNCSDTIHKLVYSVCDIVNNHRHAEISENAPKNA